jgi:PAS domain S-box-containing protein
LQGLITSWNEGAARIFGYEASEMIGQSIIKIIPEDLRDEEVEIIAKVRKGERVTHYETQRVTKDNRRIDVSLTVSPVMDRSGTIIGASKVARDISSRKHAEEAQKLLVRELNHRVRNTLSVVQSITFHTMRKSKSMEDFSDSFLGRIKGMAAAHTLLTETNWDGADIISVVRSQLNALDDDNRITLKGPALHLTSQLTLQFGMLIHELATNSRKYGALSRAAGHLEISWSLTSNGNRMIALHWSEVVDFEVKAPLSRGFGSTLIQTVAQQNGGDAELSFRPHGITWDIRLNLATPAEDLSSDTSTTGEYTSSAGQSSVQAN